MIACKKRGGVCGKKSCFEMFKNVEGVVIGLCLCGDGYYMDENLECQGRNRRFIFWNMNEISVIIDEFVSLLTLFFKYMLAY